MPLNAVNSKVLEEIISIMKINCELIMPICVQRCNVACENVYIKQQNKIDEKSAQRDANTVRWL